MFAVERERLTSANCQLTAGSSARQRPCYHPARYLRRPFEKELEFGVTSINFDIAKILSRAEDPK